MAFTIRDMADLTRVLGEHPEWRAELRRLVLTDALISVPELIEDQAASMRQLTERVDQLAVRMNQLAERVDHLTTVVEKLALSQSRAANDIAEMKGVLLEMVYRDRAPAYFGRLLRKVRVVGAGDVVDDLEAALEASELGDALLADLFVRGVVRGEPEAREVCLVVEVLNIVDRSDVERAGRRAALFRRAGLPAVGVAAGKRMTDGARAAAVEQRVALFERQTPWNWEGALEGLAA